MLKLTPLCIIVDLQSQLCIVYSNFIDHDSLRNCIHLHTIMYMQHILLCKNMIGENSSNYGKIQSSRVNEGYHNVPCSFSDGESLVPVGEPARVHEGPAHLGLGHTAVVAQEPTPSALQNQLQLNDTLQQQQHHQGCTS